MVRYVVTVDILSDLVTIIIAFGVGCFILLLAFLLSTNNDN
jgi:hypothetical protein